MELLACCSFPPWIRAVDHAVLVTHRRYCSLPLLMPQPPAHCLVPPAPDRIVQPRHSIQPCVCVWLCVYVPVYIWSRVWLYTV